MEPVFFIGYKYLEELLTVIDKTRPVFATITIEQERSDLSQRSERIVIMVAQPEQDLVQYCRLPVAIIRYLDGQKAYSSHEEQRANEIWEKVRTWLAEQGLAVRPGLVAAPAELQLLDGWARFL